MGATMKIGDIVEWDNADWVVTHIEDRNTYEPIKDVKQLGNVVILEKEGHKIAIYDFDL